MERCPTCQARLREGPTCHRCRTDVTRLRAIEAERVSRLRRAFVLLARGEREEAQRAVQASLQLKRDSLALALLGFLSDQKSVPASAMHPLIESEPQADSPLPEPVHEDSIKPEQPPKDQSVAILVRSAWQKLRTLIKRS